MSKKQNPHDDKFDDDELDGMSIIDIDNDNVGIMKEYSEEDGEDNYDDQYLYDSYSDDALNDDFDKYVKEHMENLYNDDIYDDPSSTVNYDDNSDDEDDEYYR